MPEMDDHFNDNSKGFISYRVGERSGISYPFITKHLDKQYKMTDDIMPLGSRRMNIGKLNKVKNKMN